MTPDRRFVPVLAAVVLAAVGWLVVRRGIAGVGADVDPEPEVERADDTSLLADLFDEFPETDNPDVVRMFIAWRLAERLGGMSDGKPQDIEKHLKRFGELYRTIARLTR